MRYQNFLQSRGMRNFVQDCEEADISRYVALLYYKYALINTNTNFFIYNILSEVLPIALHLKLSTPGFQGPHTFLQSNIFYVESLLKYTPSTFKYVPWLAVIRDNAAIMIFPAYIHYWSYFSSGDSQARRFFTALVLFLTNNYLNGAIKEEYKTNKDIVASCEGDYQILNNDCRKYIITSSKDVKQLCDEEIDFELEYFADFRTYVNSETTAKYESTYDQDRTYIIVGAGTHFNSDHSTFLQYYFKYMVEGKGTRVWPRYIVETLHEVYSRVSTKKRQEFNKVVQEYVAEQANLDVFDNFMLSSMLESYDGRTHGLKFHMLKVDILMHYFYNKDSCQK